MERSPLHTILSQIRGQRQKMVKHNEPILKHPCKMISHTVERIR